MTTDDRTCFNCDDPLPSQRKAFCCDRCSEFASLIRWVRRHGWHSIETDDELTYAYECRLRFVLTDGYRTHHNIKPETRAVVIRRDGGKCVLCGADGEDVDHIGPTEDEAAYNEADNLQLLCKTCHREKTESGLVLVKMTPLQKARYDELRERIDSPKPLRKCDDHNEWEKHFRRLPYLEVLNGLLEAGATEERACQVVDDLIARKQAKKTG